MYIKQRKMYCMLVSYFIPTVCLFSGRLIFHNNNARETIYIIFRNLWNRVNFPRAFFSNFTIHRNDTITFTTISHQTFIFIASPFYENFSFRCLCYPAAFAGSIPPRKLFEGNPLNSLSCIYVTVLPAQNGTIPSDNFM